jgi:hypothetical protein
VGVWQNSEEKGSLHQNYNWGNGQWCYLYFLSFGSEQNELSFKIKQYEKSDDRQMDFRKEEFEIIFHYCLCEDSGSNSLPQA